MKALFGFFVGLNRFCFALEASKSVVNAIGRYGGTPSAAPVSVWGAPMNSNVLAGSFAKSGFLRFVLVLHVFCMRNIAQIAKSIVVFYAVDVVNLTSRPFSGHVKPSKSMGSVINPAYPKLDVALFVQSMVDFVPRAQFSFPAFQSLKKPGFGIVRDKFFQSLLRQFTIVHAHAVALLCNGLGSDTDRPDRRLVLRHFKA